MLTKGVNTHTNTIVHVGTVIVLGFLVVKLEQRNAARAWKSIQFLERKGPGQHMVIADTILGHRPIY